MHPDLILAGLRRELERFPERSDAIEAEIRSVERLPRPATLPDDRETVVDRTAGLVRALEREKTRASSDRHAEIDAEIARVKAEYRSSRTSLAIDAPGVEDTTNSPARRGRPPRIQE